MKAHWVALQAILLFTATRVDASCYPTSKINEIAPLFVETKLNDKVIIAIPKPPHALNGTYFLTQPNGEVYDLNILENREMKNISEKNDSDNEIVSTNSTYRFVRVTSLNPTARYRTLTPSKNIRIVDENEGNINSIVIEALTDNDFGNWLVSTCYVDSLGENIELSQIVSVHIQETINTIPRGTVAVASHQDLKIRLDRDIPELRSCELVPPASAGAGASDRAYERDPAPAHRAACAFLLRDVSSTDAGEWQLVAVGRIVYVARLTVIVSD